MHDVLVVIGVVTRNGILNVHSLLWSSFAVSTHAELNVHVIEQVLISGRIGQLPSGVWCLVLLVPTHLPSGVGRVASRVPMMALLSAWCRYLVLCRLRCFGHRCRYGVCVCQSGTIVHSREIGAVVIFVVDMPREGL